MTIHDPFRWVTVMLFGHVAKMVEKRTVLGQDFDAYGSN